MPASGDSSARSQWWATTSEHTASISPSNLLYVECPATAHRSGFPVDVSLAALDLTSISRQDLTHGSSRMLDAPNSASRSSTKCSLRSRSTTATLTRIVVHLTMNR